eukprot:CAMPEP_0204531916 /NCGR_PEP_ID=MMETSP0661-20131031/11432_1 /ASSEMBLY_ACC=CAM_ASM_000606 /TAXON_ID=109239 /ORGANISM="Alexandrium margalefi, Strain AMGDE01CS-322" /LENGTH=301 /DNA_ID=CAMNT_0051538105 /DNA_START=82 /DNA_END=987 /DNA_ORIENTATION=+
MRLAAATSCGLLAAPLFVAPGTQRPPVARLGLGSEAAGLASEAAAQTLGNGLPPLCLGAAAAATAAAVAARGRGQVRRTAYDASKELGIQAPVQFWDPLGFCESGTEADFKRRRAVEIKHGRISMLACIGFIVPEYFRFPGYLSPSADLKFTDVPNGFAALSKVPMLGWAQIVIFAGMMEGRFLENQKEPGNFGFGNLGACGLLGPVTDPEERARKLNAEIANGRLAMFAIIGLFFQNGVTGATGSELYGFGENSGTIIGKILLPAFIAFAIGGETFRNGPDEKFLKYFPRNDYYGKDKRI